MTLLDALEIFGISSINNQTEDSLRKIYHTLAQKHHPDKGGSAEIFIRVRQAFSTLKKEMKNPGSSTSYSSTSTEDASNSKANSQSQTSYNKKTIYTEQEFKAVNDQLKAYKFAFEESLKTVEKYENIFNSQIRLINNTNSRINKYSQQFEAEKEQARIKLDAQLERLEKLKKQNWFEYIAGIKKLSEEEYVAKHNRIIGEFNRLFQSKEDKFISELIKLYQSGNSGIINLLNDL